MPTCTFIKREASEDARRRARGLNVKKIIQTALEVGQRPHVKLEKESQKVITTSTKVEDDPEHPPQILKSVVL